MRSILLELKNTSVDIQAVAIITTDGLVIASVLPQEYDEDYLGEISASTLLLGGQAMQLFAHCTLNRMFIDCVKNIVVIERIGEETLLTMVLSASANVDALSLDIDKTREKIIAHNSLF